MIAVAMALPLGEPQLATFVDSRDGQRYRTLRDLDNGNSHRSSMWRSPVEKDYALSLRCVRPR
jgi:hypothetical protein